MRTESDQSIQQQRLYRMKHMRFDGMKLVQMVPTLISEGLLPEHEKHENLRPWKKGSRSDERAAEICERCEHAIGELWRNNVRNLTSDETRWLWYADMEALAATCLRDYREESTVVTKKKRYPEADSEDKAVMIEVTERTEVRVRPQLLDLYRVVLNDMARLAGVPIGELDESEGEDEGDTPRGDNDLRGTLVVKRPAGRGETDKPN